jgi:hypothetical protein
MLIAYLVVAATCITAPIRMPPFSCARQLHIFINKRIPATHMPLWVACLFHELI